MVITTYLRKNEPGWIPASVEVLKKYLCCVRRHNGSLGEKHCVTKLWVEVAALFMEHSFNWKKWVTTCRYADFSIGIHLENEVTLSLQGKQLTVLPMIKKNLSFQAKIRILGKFITNMSLKLPQISRFFWDQSYESM